MSINGIDSLMKKLNALGGNVNKVLEISISKQTKLIQGEAKDLCPVDTGDLRKSIFTDVNVSSSKVTGKVFTNNEYAGYVEFGTGRVGETTPVADKYPGELAYKQDKWLANIPDVGLRYVAGQPAQPYMYPAIKNNEDKILGNIKLDLKEAIEKVVKK
ncbi:HK97-gp10 family putative phage morphogenesis protein [Clostridium culturomicium]|uniref:HK97-gp10 family putative phage morphogenesis protein n=1 Tax=Clostridium culturomicium TaxID=1499683 RepID=UPI00058F8B67|nr:HK97-gp10 family putative phage morphogenesis protein [Clostridium culturomicium]